MLQPKLNLKVSQRQALTPGLVQMVSVLALNKLELREMINTEMIENPVLEELEENISTIEERAGVEGDRERSAEEKEPLRVSASRKTPSTRLTLEATSRIIWIPASEPRRTSKSTTSLPSSTSSPRPARSPTI